MIRIECEHITLRLLTVDDIEQVRQWRNAPHVSEQMEYRQIITADAQQNWFKGLHKEQDLYFILQTSNEPIGVVNLKNINWGLGTAEAGVFIGNKAFLGTGTPVLAVFILMKTAFECFSLQQLTAKISDNNLQAIQFNGELGYKFQAPLNEGYAQYICTRDDFYTAGPTIKKIHTLFRKNGYIKIYADQDSAWLLPHLQMAQGFEFKV